MTLIKKPIINIDPSGKEVISNINCQYTGDSIIIKEIDYIPEIVDDVIFFKDIIKNKHYKRIYNGFINVRWFGAKGDNTTDDTESFNKAAIQCKANRVTLFIPEGRYIISSTVLFDDINVDADDAYSSFIISRVNITAIVIRGTRRKISNFSVWFELGNVPALSSAIGIKFATNSLLSANDQFSNNIVENVYIRYAYNSFSCNSLGNSGTLWNNTFINCRSDFAVSYGWYFNSIVGSTTQTWIDCMIDGVNDNALYPSAGWYTNLIDDVAWINCQADDNYDGKAIYVNLATSVFIKNFRSEANQFRTNNSSLIYVNSENADIGNIKLQASTIMVGTGVFSVIRFGANGSGIVGDVSYESNDFQSGNVFKVNTNGIAFGKGKVTIVSPKITSADVFKDDLGERTVFLNKIGKIGVNNNLPTSGTFENADQFINGNLSETNRLYGKICISAGTFGTLTNTNATTTQDSKLITVNSTSSLREGMYISIAGVAGKKRIVHIKTTTILFVDVAANVAVSNAAVSFVAPIFINLNTSSTYEIGSGNNKIITAINPIGGQFKSAVLNEVGAIRIQLPSNSNAMYTIKGTLFQYDILSNKNRTTSFIITCYGSNMDNGYSATFIGNNAPNYIVRWYSNNMYPAIYIGELNSTWSYVGVTIDNVQASFAGANLNDVSFGWNISLVTEFTGTLLATQTDTLPKVKPAALSSNTATLANGANPTKVEFDNLVNDFKDLKAKLLASGLQSSS